MRRRVRTTSPKILPLNNGDTQPIRGTNPPAETAAAYDYSSPANSNASTQGGTGLKPSAMMRAMLNPPQGSLLRGQPVTLMEAIGGARNRAEQTERVSAYWDMCSAVADYYLGLREQVELGKLRIVRPTRWTSVVASGVGTWRAGWNIATSCVGFTAACREPHGPWPW